MCPLYWRQLKLNKIDLKRKKNRLKIFRKVLLSKPWEEEATEIE